YNLNFNSTSYDRLGTNSLIGQAPLFNDLSTYDFNLAENSPAIDQGTAVEGCFSPTDYLGMNRPIGVAPDMGAYEQVKSLFLEPNEPNPQVAALTVYPNPASTRMYIEGHAPFRVDVLVRIIDVFGKKVYEQSGSNQPKMEVNVSKWAAGIYTIQLITPNNTLAYAVMIQ
ncbi:MAG: choice-of-anchor Q domain-containing protein, partial [Bacteroidota bacterium]